MKEYTSYVLAHYFNKVKKGTINFSLYVSDKKFLFKRCYLISPIYPILFTSESMETRECDCFLEKRIDTIIYEHYFYLNLTYS